MSIRLTLHIIAAQDVDPIPSLKLGSAGDHISNWISRASDGEIGFDVKHHISAQSDSNGVNAATLQLMSQRVIDSPPPGQVATNIALILCRDWVVKGALNGLMFDYDGYDSLLGTTFRSDGTPREACALFMNPLRDRGEEFVSRAALHELGHVFNLAHDAGGTSFMATPQPGLGYKDSDATALARAGAGISPEDRIHLPGLSNFEDMQPHLRAIGRGRKRGRPQRPELSLRVRQVSAAVISRSSSRRGK